MKIVFTGGSSGGHFYPHIAVAQQIREQVKERKLLEPSLIYVGSKPFDSEALLNLEIQYIPGFAGKIRREKGGAISNFFGMFKTLWGIVQATFQLFSIYPDVIFSKGGYDAFPTLVAARLLAIPVVIHDSDSTPGRVSLWSSKFAKWIAVAYPGVADLFSPKVRDRIALVGNPIRREIEHPTREGGHEFLKLDPTVPTIFVLGGSQGAEAINDVIVDTLLELIEKYNVIHQAGAANIDLIKNLAQAKLQNSRYEERYRPFGLLNPLALRMAAGVTDLIVCRAGSGTIFEIASWQIPAIVIPIPEDVSHDQRKNAYAYARAGAAEVMEQSNLTPHLFVAEVNRLMDDEASRAAMKEAAGAFARPDAARKIAHILLETALEHTK